MSPFEYTAPFSHLSGLVGDGLPFFVCLFAFYFSITPSLQVGKLYPLFLFFFTVSPHSLNMYDLTDQTTT